MTEKLLFRTLIFAALLLFAPPLHAQTRSEDKEKLEHAIEYFNDGKYHEALLIFRDITQRHELSGRMMAQMALCEYYDWNYDRAVEILDTIIPALTPYAPHERSVYYYAAAESHFNLQQYRKAAPYYQLTLTVCFPKEKAQAYYRLGFCYLFDGKPEIAREMFSKALQIFTDHPEAENAEARIRQLRKMLRGLEKSPDSDVPR